MYLQGKTQMNQLLTKHIQRAGDKQMDIACVNQKHFCELIMRSDDYTVAALWLFVLIASNGEKRLHIPYNSNLYDDYFKNFRNTSYKEEFPEKHQRFIAKCKEHGISEETRNFVVTGLGLNFFDILEGYGNKTENASAGGYRDICDAKLWRLAREQPSETASWLR